MDIDHSIVSWRLYEYHSIELPNNVLNQMKIPEQKNKNKMSSDNSVCS